MSHVLLLFFPSFFFFFFLLLLLLKASLLFILFSYVLLQKHVNPCFYKANGKTSFERLEKDKCQKLINGDRFSLLPDGELSYKVVSKVSEPVATNEEDKDTKEEAPTAVSGIGSSDGPSSKKDNAVDDLLFGDPAPSARSGTESSLPEAPVPTENKDRSKEKTVNSPSLESSSLSSDLPPKLVHSSSSTTGKKRVLPSWLSATSGTTKLPALDKTESKASVAKKGVKRKAPDKTGDLHTPDLSSEKSVAASLPPTKVHH